MGLIGLCLHEKDTWVIAECNFFPSESVVSDRA